MERDELQLPELFVREWKAQLSGRHNRYSEFRYQVNSAMVATWKNYPRFALIECWQWLLAPLRCTWLWILKGRLCRSQALSAERYNRLIVTADRVLNYLEFGRASPSDAWRHYARALIYQMDREGKSASRAMFKWRMRQAFLSYALRRTEGSCRLRLQPTWIFRLCQVLLVGTSIGLTFFLATGFLYFFQAGEITEASLICFFSAELLTVPIMVLYHFGYGWRWGYEFLFELDLGLIEAPSIRSCSTESA